MSIERFFIIANRDKDKGQAFSYEIRDFLEGKGKKCHIVYSDEERAALHSQLRGSTD